MKKLLIATFMPALCMTMVLFSSCESKKTPKILVFSKTVGFRHQSIKAGKKAVMELGQENGFVVDTTEDAALFTEDSLKHYAAVVFLNTTMDVLNHVQQADFERFIQAGGGFVGIHAAADTEYDWPWYNKLVGAYFDSHPKVQEALIRIQDIAHPTTSHLPKEWKCTDEWYNYKKMNPDVKVLAKLDETSYEGGKNGDHHPIAWFHEYDGGRAFYTGRGHTDETYSEPEYRKHILEGIKYAIGKNKLNYKKAVSKRVPDVTRFQQTIYMQGLDEPMEMVVFKNKKVLFVQRKGEIRLYDPAIDSVRTIATMKVHTNEEDGLLGLAKDPDFENNGWIYLFYSFPGDEAVQHVSRFFYDKQKDLIDFASEKVLIKIPVQREECCHSGGGLEFGPDGNLYISVGDNTNPFDISGQKYNSNGYGPMNEKPGFSSWDAQRSSGNLNDLRGAILRIKPTAEGTYTIPEGNLLPKDGSKGRPEIYIKGCRNPFRIAIDSKRNWLYWGDVGPDASEDHPERGPRGHDEVNQARKAGYFGWPYFVGNNKPYLKINYATGVSDPAFFDPNAPKNTSPNNTGPQDLPPAQPAFIYYPYAESRDFPLLEKGGRNAMAGPTYYYADYQGENKLPDYYDGKLFVYDWIRGWMRAVTLDKEGNLEKLEPFLETFTFANPIDVEMGDDGAIYVLEYGKGWFTANLDARLSRIDFIQGNRAPIAKVEADKQVGGLPLTVNFTGSVSLDRDKEDKLSYAWSFTDASVQSTDENPSFTFDKPGKYKVKLRVSDSKGLTDETSVEILAGNEPAKIEIAVLGNRSFYWENEKINYQVSVADREDGVPSTGVSVSLDYIPAGQDLTEIAQGHKQNSIKAGGEGLIAGSDCASCHKLNEKSIGPSYLDIAKKYDAAESTVGNLAYKIINGGGGVWGEHAMAAHPQFSLEEASSMARYILSLDEKKTTLPAIGAVAAKKMNPAGGSYILSAAYTDKGANSIPSLAVQEYYRLRPSNMPAYAYDEASKGVSKYSSKEVPVPIVMLPTGNWIKYEKLDLQGIGSILLSGGGIEKGLQIEIRAGSIDGPVISGAELPLVNVEERKVPNLSLALTHQATEPVDIYILIKGAQPASNGTAVIASLTFMKGKSIEGR